ncbi:MAG: lysophospholipid acyltransferase family protein [Pirellulales bacterium]
MTRRSLPAQLWYALLWCVCWSVSQVLFRFRFTGRDHVPKTGPVLLAANHQSHLDPVLIGIACPRPTGALARRELFFWPLGWLIRSLGAVPIDRGRGAALSGFKATLKSLREGQTMLVFPEGTRTHDGQLQPFHSGFCALARRSGATIVPVAIVGAFAALPRGRAFPRPRPITLAFAPPITPEQYDGYTDAQFTDLVAYRVAEGLKQSPSLLERG